MLISGIYPLSYNSGLFYRQSSHFPAYMQMRYSASLYIILLDSFQAFTIAQSVLLNSFFIFLPFLFFKFTIFLPCRRLLRLF